MKNPAAAELDDLLAVAGFLCLGECPVNSDDSFPGRKSFSANSHIKLIGSTGPNLWSAFKRSLEFSDGKPQPLDRYTKRELTRIAASRECLVVFPFEGPPYYPFQQWAARCGGFSQSPLGVFAHSEFGPWAGFRAAYIVAGQPSRPALEAGAGPCGNCVEKPCISACPVDAISLSGGYDVPRCRTHLASSQSLDCWSGCLARRACPFGSEHAQAPENARFHMESFARF